MADGAFRSPVSTAFQVMEPPQTEGTAFQAPENWLSQLKNYQARTQPDQWTQAEGSPWAPPKPTRMTNRAGVPIPSASEQIGAALTSKPAQMVMDWANFAGPGMGRIPRPVMAAEGAGGGGIRAYHGSPHDFERFDLSRIGTGEGAQAYGHGLYFAEAEAVAKGYRDKLTDRTNFVRSDGSTWDPNKLLHLNVRATARSGNLDAAIARASEIAMEGGPVSKMAAHDLATLQQIKDAGGIKPNPGRMYEVNIKADPEHFLDWDKQHNEQSAFVAAALQKAKAEGKFPNAVRRYIPRTPEETAALREAGIPGIRYRDAGSRGADGNPTHNLVVFDDSLIDILRKYGLAGLMAGGAAASQGQPAQAKD